MKAIDQSSIDNLEKDGVLKQLTLVQASNDSLKVIAGIDFDKPVGHVEKCGKRISIQFDSSGLSRYVLTGYVDEVRQLYQQLGAVLKEGPKRVVKSIEETKKAINTAKDGQTIRIAHGSIGHEHIEELQALVQHRERKGVFVNLDMEGRIRPDGRIWMAAQQFYDVATQIWDNNEPAIDDYTYPIIVNFAFACELAMKASEATAVYPLTLQGGILPASKTESQVHGHKLKTILSKLHESTQTAIKANFERTTSRELMPLLEKCDDYFAKARYGYEKTTGFYRLSDVRELAKGLLFAVKELEES